MNENLIEEVASDDVLEQSLAWLCTRRKDYSPNDDVWIVRERWDQVKPQLRLAMLSGKYQLQAVRRVRANGETFDIWQATDALVLKAISIVLTKHLKGVVSSSCHHFVGNGGAKEAVRRVAANVSDHKFVFRTDVKSYYASIDHDILLRQVRSHTADPIVLDLIEQYVRRHIYDAGPISFSDTRYLSWMLTVTADGSGISDAD